MNNESIIGQGPDVVYTPDEIDAIAHINKAVDYYQGRFGDARPKSGLSTLVASLENARNKTNEALEKNAILWRKIAITEGERNDAIRNQGKGRKTH